MKLNQVKELYNMIVRPAMRQYQDELKSFMSQSDKELLPLLSVEHEKQIINFIRKKGYHQSLQFKKLDSGFGYETEHKDEKKQSFKINFDPENSPLRPSFRNQEVIGVYAKLTPVLRKKTVDCPSGDVTGNFITVCEKQFDLSLITIK